MLNSTPLVASATNPLCTFVRRQVLPAKPHVLWRIHAGLVRTLTWNDEGDIVPVGFWGPGSLLGPEIAQVTPYEIHPLTRVEASPVSAYLPLPNRVLLEHVQHTSAMMRILHHHRVEDRLVNLLVWLAKRFGKLDPRGLQMQLPLTHQEIAETIGTTRVTVTRMLKHLEAEGKVTWSRHQQVIHRACLTGRDLRLPRDMVVS